MCIWNVAEVDRKCKFCTLTSCNERRVFKSGKSGKITSTMRAMTVGQELKFPIGSYGACRTAASRLHSDFLSRFLVTSSEYCVIVTRLS